MVTTNVLRMTQADFSQMAKLFMQAGDQEAQAFLLCSQAQGPHERIFLVSRLLIPDGQDVEEQTGASVAPTAQFQATAYGLARDYGLSVVDAHTHPFSEEASLSGIDFHHGIQNARYLAAHLAEPSTMGMIVFGNTLHACDGQIWNRNDNQFEPIHHVEVLGSPTTILGISLPEETGAQDPYARQRLIPGWRQEYLECLKVFIVGLGGNGALALAAWLALGVGRRGWIKACDPDLLEASNLPRIPYAFPTDVGQPKAQVAQAYARQKAPDTPVRCYPQSILDADMQALAKEAHVIIGAVDNEGARKILNALAIRHLNLYLDLATEIIPDTSGCEMVGQVRTVIPGQGGCLMCSGLIDVTEAALDLLPEQEQARRAQRGYVRGTNQTPTPSVLPLNGVTTYLAVAHLVQILLGQHPTNSGFLHYNQQEHQLITAAIKPNPGCPVCGEDGYLGAGDEVATVGDQNGPSTGTFRFSQGHRCDEDDGALSQSKEISRPNSDSQILNEGVHTIVPDDPPHPSGRQKEESHE